MGDAITRVKVLVMVSDVVSLHGAKVLSDGFTMMKVVVSKVVHDVTGEEAGHESTGNIDGEEGADNGIVEGSGDGCSKGWGHDEAHTVHGEVMVDAMEDKVDEEADGVIGDEIIEVEDKTMKEILNEGPETQACNIPREGGGGTKGGLGPAVEDPGDREPNQGNDPPRGHGEGLEEGMTEEDGRLRKVPGFMDLFEIKGL